MSPISLIGVTIALFLISSAEVKQCYDGQSKLSKELRTLIKFSTFLQQFVLDLQVLNSKGLS